MSETTCMARECGRPVQARGYCNTHYARWYRTGSPELPNRPSLAERLWSRTEVRENGCWEYVGCINRGRGGYGRIRADLDGRRRVLNAHAAAWEVTHGPVPQGMVVRHRCDNPPCVNPDHLELGTYAENSADMVARGRALTGERNPMAKLTDRDRAALEAALQTGRPAAELARKFGLTVSRVNQIKKGAA